MNKETKQSAQQFMTRALEARNGLVSTSVKAQAGTLPASASGVTVSRPGVVVTAFGTDPDGNDGTLLRIWELAGISGKLTVTLPEGMQVSSAQPVNLRGEKAGEAYPVKSGKLELDLPKYAPASFILK